MQACRRRGRYSFRGKATPSLEGENCKILRTVPILACALANVFASAYAQPPAAPTQPIPFNHKVHAGDLKVACKMCHRSPDPGEMMGIAAPEICLQCHSVIKTESNAIQKLSAAAKENREIRWERVYAIPFYVAFSHRYHLEGGTMCQDCHGKVSERVALYREGDISMSGCINCHRARKIGTNCTFCHDPR